MAWQVYVLLLTAIAEECPVYLCSSEVKQECLTQNGTHVVLAECPEELSCASFSLMKPENRTCSSPVPENSEDRVCHGTKSEGDLCVDDKECGEWFYCGRTRDLEDRCLPVVKVGKHCQNTRMCRAGSVCHNGMCLEYFSIPAGEAAESKIACESARLKDGVCLPPSESIVPIPVRCDTDTDCRATDDTYSECSCARNSKGAKYCTLHESDEPVKRFLESVHNEFLESSGSRMMEMVYYPQLVAPEDCFLQAAEEFRELKQFQDWHEKCAGALVSLTTILLLS